MSTIMIIADPVLWTAVLTSSGGCTRAGGGPRGQGEAGTFPASLADTTPTSPTTAGAQPLTSGCLGMQTVHTFKWSPLLFFYKNHDKNSPPGHAIIVQLSCYLSGISMTEDPTWRAQSLLSVGGWSTSIVSRWVEMFMFDDHNWPDILCPRTGTIRVAAWPTGGSLSPTMWSIAGWPGTDHHG